MRKINRLVLISSVFLLGVFSGYFFAEARQAKSSHPQEASDIFRALLLSSSLPIPKQKLSCEAAGAPKITAKGTEYRDTKLSDYIVSYLLWSQEKTRSSSHSLSCEGDTVKNCTWVFGESKSSEGWERILKFEYNVTTRSVVPSSLECMDVP